MMLWLGVAFCHLLDIAAGGVLTAVAAGETVSIHKAAWTDGALGTVVGLLDTVAILTQVENPALGFLMESDRPAPYAVAVFLDYYGMLLAAYVAPALLAGLAIWNHSGRLSRTCSSVLRWAAVSVLRRFPVFSASLNIWRWRALNWLSWI